MISGAPEESVITIKSIAYSFDDNHTVSIGVISDCSDMSIDTLDNYKAFSHSNLRQRQ